MLLECSYLQLRCELERQREEYNRRSYWGAVLKFDLQITSSSSCKWEWRNVWNLCQDMNNICLFAMLLKPHSNIKKAFEVRLWSAKRQKQVKFRRENNIKLSTTKDAHKLVQDYPTYQLRDCPHEIPALWPQFLSPSMHVHTACNERKSIYFLKLYIL